MSEWVGNELACQVGVEYQPAEHRYQTMEYRRCGKSGLLLPALSFGLWHNFGQESSFPDNAGLVPHCLRCGNHPF